MGIPPKTGLSAGRVIVTHRRAVQAACGSLWPSTDAKLQRHVLRCGSKKERPKQRQLRPLHSTHAHIGSRAGAQSAWSLRESYATRFERFADHGLDNLATDGSATSNRRLTRSHRYAVASFATHLLRIRSPFRGLSARITRDCILSDKRRSWSLSPGIQIRGDLPEPLLAFKTQGCRQAVSPRDCRHTNRRGRRRFALGR
jgi:hypothetical protein